MTRPRSEQIISGQPGFYHCISRCVRRSRLCGFDPETGHDYDHRRDWIVDRMRLLTTCFAIDVYAYAVMSNHTHIVLYVDPARNEKVSDEEIAKRWRLLWKWRRPENPENALIAPSDASAEKLKTWRDRLGDVSWFMRMLNEPLARIANMEDDCNGHFWESRFKSLPLLDDAAVIACMAYVDLNPIKAGVSETVEDSEYTSIQARICQMINNPSGSRALGPVFEEDTIELHSRNDRTGITSLSYIDLIKMTADRLRYSDLDRAHPSLLALGISPNGWVTSATNFLAMFRTAAGRKDVFEARLKASNQIRLTDSVGRRTLYES